MTLLDSKPPEALLGDKLTGIFGKSEMEQAMQLIISLAVKEGTWRVEVNYLTFLGQSTAMLKGFENLVGYGWLLPMNTLFKGYTNYRLDLKAIRRLEGYRPQAFGTGKWNPDQGGE